MDKVSMSYLLIQAFQWIFCTLGINFSLQRDFFTNSTGDSLPAQGFPGSLYNFCKLVIIFFNVNHNDMWKLWHMLQIWKWLNATKKMWLKLSSMKTKNYLINYTRCTTLRNNIISCGLCWDVWLLWEYQNKILTYNKQN